jgi:hypothetical protein
MGVSNSNYEYTYTIDPETGKTIIECHNISKSNDENNAAKSESQCNSNSQTPIISSNSNLRNRKLKKMIID